VHPCALTSADRVASSEALWFSTDRDTCNSFVDSSYPGEKQIIPVSTLHKELSGQAPILAKIDVEGFESDVLSGAGQLLAHESCFAVIIEGQD
jgi:FkbM family methyltransferase